MSGSTNGEAELLLWALVNASTTQFCLQNLVIARSHDHRSFAGTTARPSAYCGRWWCEACWWRRRTGQTRTWRSSARWWVGSS